MPAHGIVERLKSGECLLLDGGTGSELQRRGVNVLTGVSAASGLQAWSALANIEAADVVQQVHQDYLRVGADIIISNNFWTSPTRLSAIGWGDRWQALARAACENALKARESGNPDAYIAAGMAPPEKTKQTTGRSEADAVTLGDAFHREFAEHARLVADMGVDVVLPEYVGHIADCVAAVDACAEAGLPVFVGVRHIQEDGSMQYGDQLEDLVAALEGHPVDAILLMCSSPEGISAGLPHLRAAFDGPVGGYANIGYHPTAPIVGATTDDQTELADRATDFLRTDGYHPARMASFARQWKDLGAQIIGGCCATGPEHIQAMGAAVK